MAIPLTPSAGKVPFRLPGSLLERIWQFLLVLVILLAIATALLFVWLRFRLQPALVDWQVQSETLSTDPKVQGASRFVVLQSQLQILKEILASHTYPTNLLKFAESFTHPRVTFKNLSVETTAKTMNLDGTAANFQALAEQIRVFENEKNIEKFNIGGFSIGPIGTVSFHVQITFSQSVLRK